METETGGDREGRVGLGDLGWRGRGVGGVGLQRGLSAICELGKYVLHPSIKYSVAARLGGQSGNHE